MNHFLESVIGISLNIQFSLGGQVELGKLPRDMGTGF